MNPIIHIIRWVAFLIVVIPISWLVDFPFFAITVWYLDLRWGLMLTEGLVAVGVATILIKTGAFLLVSFISTMAPKGKALDRVLIVLPILNMMYMLYRLWFHAPISEIKDVVGCIIMSFCFVDLNYELYVKYKKLSDTSMLV